MWSDSLTNGVHMSKYKQASVAPTHTVHPYKSNYKYANVKHANEQKDIVHFKTHTCKFMSS